MNNPIQKIKHSGYCSNLLYKQKPTIMIAFDNLELDYHPDDLFLITMIQRLELWLEFDLKTNYY